MIIRKDQLKLVAETNSILNTPPSEYVFDDLDSARLFANLLFTRMKELGGVGLSANQVGVNAKVFVMGIDEVKLFIFNPIIISHSKKETNFNEGCLSFPGITLDVKRPETIEVRFQNENGEVVEQVLSGLTARIFQHEYDHMMGNTFKKHVSPMKWAMAVKKFKHKKEKIVKKHASKIVLDILKDAHNNASEVSR